MFSEKYAGLLPYLTAIALIVPVRAYMIINANVLFVHQKTATGTKINFAGAGGVALLSFALYFSFGLWGVVVGTVLVEIGSALVFKHHSRGIIASECQALAIAGSGALALSGAPTDEWKS
jgi:O-antigen/teichoic acid export membrane protein